jgi:hypothetical protein
VAACLLDSGMTDLLGMKEIVVLLIGFVMTFITSPWSRVLTTTGARLVLFGILLAFLTIPEGLSEAKSLGKHAFIFGKAAVFYGWAFGLWFSLALCRSDRKLFKYSGYLSALLFSRSL